MQILFILCSTSVYIYDFPSLYIFCYIEIYLHYPEKNVKEYVLFLYMFFVFYFKNIFFSQIWINLITAGGGWGGMAIGSESGQNQMEQKLFAAQFSELFVVPLTKWMFCDS